MDMIIEKMRMRYFRGIVSGEIEFSPLTILVGGNGSGKTTLLEALFLLNGFSNDNPYSVQYVLSTIHSTLTSNSLDHLIYGYGSRFKKASIEYILSNNRQVLLEILSEDDTLCIKGYNNSEGRKTIELARIKRFSIAGSYSSYGFYKVLFIRGDIVKLMYNFMYSRWIDIVNKGITKTVAEDLAGITGLKAIDIIGEAFGSGTYSLMLYLENGYRVRLGDLGDGLQLVTVFEILTKYIDPDIILWDDIESHMNPQLLIYVVNKLVDAVENGKQVVVTTHSIEAVKTITGLYDKAKCAKLCLDNGFLKIEYFNRDSIEELEKLGVDIRV